MEYQVGRVGKVIGVRLVEGDDICACIEEVARKERISSAAVFVLGGLRRAGVVSGPVQADLPKIVPDFRQFEGPGDLFGVGTIYPNADGPKVHLHVGIGKGTEAVVGCVRKASEVFITLEVTIIEMADVHGVRRQDPERGFECLRF